MKNYLILCYSFSLILFVVVQLLSQPYLSSYFLVSEFDRGQINLERIIKNDIILSKLNWKILSYLGGSANDGFVSVVNHKSSIYIGGSTSSSDFPRISNIYGVRGQSDIVVIKMDFDGKVDWVTVLSSFANDYLFCLAIDSSGNIWGCGESRGQNFPTTKDAFQRIFGGNGDGVVFKLDPNGILVYSTFLGGSEYEGLTHLVVNVDNTIWVTGRTRSANFPTTSNAKDKSLDEEYNTPIIRLSNNGQLLYSSFFGGSSPSSWSLGDVIDCMSDGKIVVAGYTNSISLPTSTNAFQKTKSALFDSFIAVFDSTGDVLWCSYFGGNGSDYGSQLTVDETNNIYILHYTYSTDLPLSNSTLNNNNSGSMDVFISKFDSLGKYLYGSYLGGPDFEAQDYGGLNYIGGSIRITRNGYISCFFKTRSSNLPTQLVNYKLDYDGYFLLLNNNMNYEFSTYLGGSYAESAGDMIPLNDTTFILCGATNSLDFPLVTPLQNKLKGGFDSYVGILTTSLLLDTIPPSMSLFSDSCGRIKTIIVTDTQNQKSGIKTITPKKLTNVAYYIVEQTQNKARIVVSLIDQDKMGYFAFEITDLSGNKRTIEDSLVANYSTLLSFSPKDSVFVGEINFDNLLCGKVWVKNLSTDTLVLHKLFLRRNIDFSIPPSQLPITIPPLDSNELTICFGPQIIQKWVYRDTLEIDEDCFFKRLTVQAQLDTNFFRGSSNCNVQIKGESVFEGKRGVIIVSAPFPKQLILQIEGKPGDVPVEIELFDVLGIQIRYIKSEKSIIELDLSALPRGTYLLRVKTSSMTYHSKILLND